MFVLNEEKQEIGKQFFDGEKHGIKKINFSKSGVVKSAKN